MTTWGELEEIQAGDVARIDTWHVSGRLLNLEVSVTVDDKGSLAESETRVSHLALASASVLGGSDTGEVASTAEVVEAMSQDAG